MNKKKDSRDKLKRCLRCGRCCYVYNFNTSLWEPCKYLCSHRDGKTSCRAYIKRIGRIVGVRQYCGWRVNEPWDYPGCPYNQGYPVHPAFVEQNKLKIR